MWEGPGFVDHHTHLLRVATGTPPPYGDARDPEAIAAWHRLVRERWSTPMDEAERPVAVDDQLRGRFERALNRAAEHGLVQVTEAGMADWGHLEALLALRARGPLPVRVRIFVASGAADVKRMARTGDPSLELEGVKFYADGWLGPRTCALCQPFEDDPDNAGVLFLDADTLARRADPFAEAGWTLATHAIGDRAIEVVLDAYEKIYGGDTRAAAPRIEHAQVLRPELVRRMAELGVVACVQPGFAVADMATARPALGPERMEDAYRWDALLDAGVRVIGGSDFPIRPLAPLVGLQELVTGDAVDGTRAGAPTLPVAAALSILTDAAAGTTVLSDDPRAVAEDELASIEVVEARPATT
jgi:predicted amidohydrolase YtcJ